MPSTNCRERWQGVLARCGVAAGLCAALLGHAYGADDDRSDRQPSVANVTAALRGAPSESRTLTFDLGDTVVPPGGHLQGIQIRFGADGERALAFLSHDSATVGYLLVVEFPADSAGAGRVIHRLTFPSDGKSPPLRHAGGIQLVGGVLVVGLEDNQQKTRSEIQFWDVSNPTEPAQMSHLTIRRSGVPKDKTAGGVGLVQREHDHLVAVANWDSRAIDFYTSNGKRLGDPNCRFELNTRWQAGVADRSDWQPDRDFASYQSVNLMADTGGDIFLAGSGMANGKDVVDLFAVDLEQPPPKRLRKLSRKAMKLPVGNHLQYAGGLSWDGARPAILSSPRNLSRQTRLGVTR